MFVRDQRSLFHYPMESSSFRAFSLRDETKVASVITPAHFLHSTLIDCHINVRDSSTRFALVTRRGRTPLIRHRRPHYDSTTLFAA